MGSAQHRIQSIFFSCAPECEKQLHLSDVKTEVRRGRRFGKTQPRPSQNFIRKTYQKKKNQFQSNFFFLVSLN